jgi:hypothetical protein
MRKACGIWSKRWASITFVGAVVGGSLALRSAGRTAAAFSLLVVLAIPGFGFALFLAAVLVLQPRWN